MTSHSADLDISATPFFPAVRRGLSACRRGFANTAIVLSPGAGHLKAVLRANTTTSPASAYWTSGPIARRWAHWQLENKPCAAQCRLIVGSNAPIVRFDDRLGDRQAQAHAGLLGRKEAIEQMR